MVINKRDVYALQSVRRIYKELKSLREDLKEQRTVTLHGISYDGTPKGNRYEDKMLNRMIRLDTLERREVQLVRKLEAARMRAYHVCRQMPSVKACAFFESYSADLQPVEVAQKISGVDKRTVRTYLKLLGEDK